MASKEGFFSQWLHTGEAVSHAVSQPLINGAIRIDFTEARSLYNGYIFGTSPLSSHKPTVLISNEADPWFS